MRHGDTGCSPFVNTLTPDRLPRRQPALLLSVPKVQDAATPLVEEKMAQILAQIAIEVVSAILIALITAAVRRAMRPA
jgi:hypothetical protein